MLILDSLLVILLLPLDKKQGFMKMYSYIGIRLGQQSQKSAVRHYSALSTVLGGDTENHNAPGGGGAPGGVLSLLPLAAEIKGCRADP